jgi:HeH/LEM domain
MSQPTIRELLDQQRRIDANINGTEFVEREVPAPAEEADSGEPDAIDPNDLTVAQLREALTEAGVEFDGGAKKAELVELYAANLL